jgi:hypothetical protein
MNITIDDRISDPVIDREECQREALFAFLDQYLADMLTLFINNLMHKGELARSRNEKHMKIIGRK